MDIIIYLLITIGFVFKFCFYSLGFVICGILLSELIDSIKKDKNNKAE